MKQRDNITSDKDTSKFQDSIRYHLKYSVGKLWKDASQNDFYTAFSLAIRERIVNGIMETEKRYEEQDVKRLFYLSLEFLMGRSLGNNLYNLNFFGFSEKALAEMDIDISQLQECESDVD